MIARKITYQGNFTTDDVATIFDITRKIEITGEVKTINNQEIVLNLEGDPSMIALLQHQIDRKMKKAIKGKTVAPLTFHYYKGLTFLS